MHSLLRANTITRFIENLNKKKIIHISCCYFSSFSKYSIKSQEHIFLSIIDRKTPDRLLKQQVCYKKTLRNSKSNILNFNKQFDKMIRIRYEQNSDRVAISVKCKITEDSEREFNLSRNLDEPIGQTFQKLYANYTKQLQARVNRANKKLKKTNEESSTSQVANLANVSLSDDFCPLSLYDLDNNLISLETKNMDAWKENYTFKLGDQIFKVTVDLPAIKKVSLSKFLVAGMPAVIKIEAESAEMNEKLNKYSKFSWYSSRNKIENGNQDLVENMNKKLKIEPQVLEKIEWQLIPTSEESSKKMCILSEDCEDKLIKVEVIPSDGSRNGLAVETVSTNVVLKKFNLHEFPMSDRHLLTKHSMGSDSLRVMTYNILANCYAETHLAREELFSYCPPEYLDFKYRRTLLVHEILNYNSDIMFFQECEVDFYEDDLNAAFPGYTHKFKSKGESREGEAILFRSDRFKFINSYDICISDELKKNPIFENLWKNISKNEQFKEYVSARSTILQVVQVESFDHPGTHYLLANTHLFFHPTADFLRLIQSIVCTKYLEKLKFKLLNENNSEIKDVKVIFAGDFNSDPPSYAFNYIFTQMVPFESLKDDEKALIKSCEEDLIHSLSLSAYTNFPFTNCIATFESTLDYVFYETDGFELTKVIPLPEVTKIKEHVALPSKYIPSDHLPLIFELSIINRKK